MKKEKLGKEPNNWKLIRACVDSHGNNGKWELKKRKQIIAIATGKLDDW